MSNTLSQQWSTTRDNLTWNGTQFLKNRWLKNVQVLFMTWHKIWDRFPEKVFFTYLLVQNMSRKLGPNSWTVFSTNTLRKAEDLMPRDIMSSEPKHWMAFGQLATPVQRHPPPPCLSTALHRHGQLAKYHRVLGSRSLVPCYLLLFVANGVAICC